MADAVCRRRHVGDGGTMLEDCQTSSAAGRWQRWHGDLPEGSWHPHARAGGRSGQPGLILQSQGLWTWARWIIWVLAWRLQGLGSSVSRFGRKLLNFVSKHRSELLLFVRDL